MRGHRLTEHGFGWVAASDLYPCLAIMTRLCPHSNEYGSWGLLYVEAPSFHMKVIIRIIPLPCSRPGPERGRRERGREDDQRADQGQAEQLMRRRRSGSGQLMRRRRSGSGQSVGRGRGWLPTWADAEWAGAGASHPCGWAAHVQGRSPGVTAGLLIPVPLKYRYQSV